MTAPSRRPVTPEEQKLIDAELRIHETTKYAVRDAALAKRSTLAQAYARGIVDLREQTSSAHTRDLPTLFDQLHSSQSLAQRTTEQKFPDMRAPYFARMRICDDHGLERDVLIGHETFFSTEHNLFIIDWKNAPLAKAYFNHKVGDSYEIDIDEKRRLRGKVVLRHTIQFEMGQIIGISTPSLELRVEEGAWFKEDDSFSVHLEGGEGQATRTFGTGMTGRQYVEVASLLDEHQYRILQASADVPLLVLGGAGSGKTTVALHRIATLYAIDKENFDQHKMLVLVPEEGLVRLSRKLLQSLGLDRVLVSTYDQWIYEQAKHVFVGGVRRLYRDTPPRVMRFKRHAAVLQSFSQLAELKFERLLRTVDRKLGFLPERITMMQQSKGPNLAQRIEDFCTKALSVIATNEQDPKRRHAYERVLSETREQLMKDLWDVGSDRIELFSNKMLLESIVTAGKPQLDAFMVKEVVQHMQNQLTPAPGPKQKDVDADYAKALDERDIDAPEEDDVYNSMDVEDLTIMFELLKFYTGHLATNRRMHTYAHLVLDEAQELAPTELQLLSHTLERKGSITIAGDAVQQTDPTSVFVGWEESLKLLGATNAKAEHLKTSYRCPEHIMHFAYDILGTQAPAERPMVKRKGPPVMISKATSEGHATAMLLEVLDDLQAKEPRASIAVIASDFETAKVTYSSLKELSHARLVRDGNFDFKPGVDVTDVAQIKGLEFDYVIIPDCDIYHYPDTPEHRRLLHVAATRAIHQLWVITVKVPSQLIPKIALGNLHNFYVHKT